MEVRPHRPCLGQPVVIDKRIYVPRLTARSTRLVWKAQVVRTVRPRQDVRLSMGAEYDGAANSMSPVMSFASTFSTGCAAGSVIFTEHPSGSLRCPPVVAMAS